MDASVFNAEYALSPMQAGMLFHSVYASHSGVDIEQMVWSLHEELQVTALEQAWRKVMERHPVLRTSFHWEGLAAPLQRVHPDVRLSLVQHDWRDISPQDQDRDFEDYLRADRQAGFDFNQAPLMRLALFRLGPSRYDLLWTFHHILLDGRSFPILITEVFNFYEASLAGQEWQAPFIRPYSDYIEWLKQQDFQLAKTFWKTLLAGFTSSTYLGVERFTPEQPVEAQGTRSVSLSAAGTKALEQLAQEAQVTLNTIVQGAWAILLGRYSGEPEVVFGATRACRRSALPGAGEMVGLFINTLPVRVRCDPQAALIPWLVELRRQHLAVRPYEHTPLVQVQEWSEVRRGQPIFESLVMFDRYRLNDILQAMGGKWKTREFHLYEQTNFPLTLNAYGGRELRLQVGYQAKRSDQQTIERLLGHLQTLLEGMARQPATVLNDLPLLLESERHRILAAGEQIQTDYPRENCLHQLFEAQVERTPESVALVFQAQRLTYREINQRANHLAHRLQKVGVGPDILVGLCLERSLEMVVGLLGILKAGGAYVPLDPRYPKERLAYLMQNAAINVLVAHQKMVPLLPSYKGQLVCLDELLASIDPSATNPSGGVSPEHLAYMIYTSGSTGQPKGVMVTHYNVVRLFQATDRWFHFGPQDVWTLFHSCAFDFSVWEIWGALLFGGRLVVVPYLTSRSPNEFYDLLCKEKITILNQTPSAFNQLIQAEETCTSRRELSLRLVIFGGEALAPASLKPWFDRHGDHWPQLVNMYGITETTVHVTGYWLCRADLDRPSLLGTPIPDLQILLLDAHQRLVPVGIPGEIHVGGAGLARGYWRRPGLTQERFLPHPFSSLPGKRLYKSGDLARYLPDGSLEYLGRVDDQVKIRGFRIELGEIEAVLCQHETVQDCVVMAREVAPGDQRLVAYVVSHSIKEGASSGSLKDVPLVEQWREHIRQKLPDYMIPSAFVALERLPLGPHGKIDRQSLPMPEASRPQTATVYQAPRTSTEAGLEKIWSKVLGIERVGVYDDFFNLGGNSLLAMQVAARMALLKAAHMPVRWLFEHPTVAELSAHIDRQSGVERGGRIPSVPRSVPLPLSHDQERLWFLHHLLANRATYNIPLAWRLRGTVDWPRLVRALAVVVQRHEALRTGFVVREGRPSQGVADTVRVDLPQKDLRSWPAGDRDREARHRMDAEVRRPFDLAAPPLFRLLRLCLDDNDHYLVLTIHHLIFDEWSMGLLGREWAEAYETDGPSAQARLPELPVQYGDYAAWQRQQVASAEMDLHRDFWRDHLAGVSATIDLPMDRSRASSPSSQGSSLGFDLDSSVATKLEQLGPAEGATPFMVGLAAFQAFLCRLTGQRDLVLGIPFARRQQTETQSLIGFFVNTLPLRIVVEDHAGFRSLLQQVRRCVMTAFEHAELPFDEIVRLHTMPRAPGNLPLLQVMFDLAHLQAEGLNLRGINAEPIRLNTGTSKFDLMLSLEKTGQGNWRGLFEFSTDLFDVATIERMIGQFQQLLVSITTTPDEPLSRLDLLPPNQRRQLLESFNPPSVKFVPKTCLHELIELQVARTPEAVAVEFEGQTLTFSQLEGRANQLARYLQRLGVGPDVLVGVCAERSLELVVALVGVLKAGGAYVPMDPGYPLERLVFLAKDSGASVLLSQERWVGRLPQGEAHVVKLDTDWALVARESAAAVSIPISPENLAYVIYTSGSTGQPKGALVPHRAIVNHMLWMQERFPVTSADAVLQKTPTSFDASVWEFFLPLMTGARLVLAKPEGHKDVDYLVDLIDRQCVTTVQFVPSLLDLFIQSSQVSVCRSLRRIFCGGEVLSLDLRRRVRDRLAVELINLYGPTETAIDVSNWVDEATDQRLVAPLGRPVANTRLYVLDAQLQPVPIGVAGELCVGGVQVGRGYLNRPELTVEKFVSDPFGADPAGRLYRTGDRCRWLPEGNLEFLGRRDNQVKIRGFRVELGEVETVLATHADVKQAVVLALEGPGGSPELVAFLIGRGPEQVAVESLRAHLGQQLPEFMVPAKFVVVEQIPLTPSGKVDRRSLADQASRLIGVRSEYVGPRHAREARLAAIWQTVLGCERIGVHDNFFDMGCHSLLAMQVVSRVNKAFHVDLPLRAIFESPTVAGLAQVVERLQATNREAKVERISRLNRSAQRPAS